MIKYFTFSYRIMFLVRYRLFFSLDLTANKNVFMTQSTPKEKTPKKEPGAAKRKVTKRLRRKILGAPGKRTTK